VEIVVLLLLLIKGSADICPHGITGSFFYAYEVGGYGGYLFCIDACDAMSAVWCVCVM